MCLLWAGDAEAACSFATNSDLTAVWLPTISSVGNGSVAFMALIGQTLRSSALDVVGAEQASAGMRNGLPQISNQQLKCGRP